MEIHNTKDRMPLVLTKEASESWLSERAVDSFAFPNYSPELVARNLDAENPKTLF